MTSLCSDSSIPIGRMEISTIQKLDKLTIGFANGGKDPDGPSVADLHLDSDDESKESSGI